MTLVQTLHDAEKQSILTQDQLDAMVELHAPSGF